MNFKQLIVGGVVGMSLLTMACGGGPSEEQIQKLVETRQAAEAAEERVDELEQRKAELQKELEAKKQELERAEAEQARVEKAVNEGGMN
ncbi:MAG: hypothetical protein GF372_09650 [Candidatus Marinimicrobia bacterium]|jgi:septal ring factor EnvC (AmiA/AmiB activator)|nr:hypothetical protein [Candidatus Neomarinimicrobiota bacterium]